jgi:hypothetical protein
MNFQTKVFLSMFVLSISFSGCSSQKKIIEKEQKFDQTTGCVYESLPQEIQFSSPENPKFMSGDTLSIDLVDQVTKKLDPKISFLLKSAMREAWNSSRLKNSGWSPSLYSEVQIKYFSEIQDLAPKILQNEFCGEKKHIGGATYAALFDYFFRAVRSEDGDQPMWFKNLGSSFESKGGSLVMVLVGLRLAEVDFDPEVVARSALVAR